MGTLREFIRKEMDMMKATTLDELLAFYADVSGFDWMTPRESPDDYRDAYYSELEMRSAFEFLRPELSGPQRSDLDRWDAKYRQWRDEGVFFHRYRDAQGGRFTWKEERADAEKVLGRIIPKNHWWYWPPEE